MDLASVKTKYKYLFTFHIKSLECSIPYKANLGVRVIRANKSTEGKKKLSTDGGSNRTFEIDEKLEIVTTLEYNPRLGCCEEKKMTIRFVTYKTPDQAKRIGDIGVNVSDFVKIPEIGAKISNYAGYKQTKD